MSRIEDQLRQLALLDRARAELAWLHYLSGEAGERDNAADLLDILLFQAAGKDYTRARSSATRQSRARAVGRTGSAPSSTRPARRTRRSGCARRTGRATSSSPG